MSISDLLNTSTVIFVLAINCIVMLVKNYTLLYHVRDSIRKPILIALPSVVGIILSSAYNAIPALPFWMVGLGLGLISNTVYFSIKKMIAGSNGK